MRAKKVKTCIICGKGIEGARNDQPKTYCNKCQSKRGVGLTVLNNMRKRFQNPVSQAHELGILQSKMTRIYFE